MDNFLPYVNAYGLISKLLEQIKTAAVPSKFTNDYMYAVLGLKSTSYRQMIPLLKRLDFLDENNVPTQVYKDFRDDTLSRSVLASKVQNAYKSLFASHEYAHQLEKKELTSKVVNLTGASKEDRMVGNIVGTFMELCKLSDFETPMVEEADKTISDNKAKTKLYKETLVDTKPEKTKRPLNLDEIGISYTINLNLPATTEVEVFNAIFKSLREHILDE